MPDTFTDTYCLWRPFTAGQQAENPVVYMTAQVKPQQSFSSARPVLLINGADVCCALDATSLSGNSEFTHQTWFIPDSEWRLPSWSVTHLQQPELWEVWTEGTLPFLCLLLVPCRAEHVLSFRSVKTFWTNSLFGSLSLLTLTFNLQFSSGSVFVGFLQKIQR